jgi:hypothetical protein
MLTTAEGNSPVAASEEEGGAFQIGAEGVQAVGGVADVG